MAFNKYDTLSIIDTTTFKWNCRVRAQAIWKEISKETQQCFGINVIFLDDSNNRIHSFVNHKFVEKLEQDLVEGQIYDLSNFKVKKYLGDETYRAYNIKFTLFNEFGEAYESAVLLRKQEPVVIIISVTKITTYEGTVNLTNYSATRVYVNPQHYYVPYLKEK
ncbi:hypothetical protein POM88_046106 [Heracleum sosnowskyi]|uniref:Replication protein A 70 kDa DNA-binding subunit B/D first OB fold domain-containing protein n=1 Tax=Heracleum sosnowskyi TaxID=360622 RepID=A0AAD8H8P9_9APIA|nr:hypothetical protein POM88_046106 [Heracleum sosnowskyi]